VEVALCWTHSLSDFEDTLEKPAAMTQKGHVKTEGYGSDSSDNEEGVVLSSWEKNNAVDASENKDNDIFIMGEKEDKEDADNV
jgi:CD2 antigen cytoplasmic tail-binding protein 2